jgi:branched-chain amino acid transport system substrate-binding protein
MSKNFVDDLYPPNDLNRVALLAENYAWADSSWESVIENVPGAEVEIVQQTRYAADTEDFTTVFDQVEENDTDVVLALAAYTSTPMVNQWANQERSFGMTGIVNSLQPSSAYGDLNGAPKYTVPWSVATPMSANTEGRTGPFAQEYINRHGMSPLYPGYCGYDAVYTYKNAVEEAGSLATGDLIEPMLNTSLDLTQGHIEFGQPDSEFPHDLIYSQEDTPQVHFQWVEEDGEGVQKPVYPSEYATAEYQHPDWI